MTQLKGKIILFIGPVFYNYHLDIINELEKLGAIIKFIPERDYGLTYSLLNTFSTDLLISYQRRYYKNILKTIDFDHIDYLFVIRGCQMPIEFIISLKEKYNDLISIMYQWDSEESNHYIHLKYQFNKIFTFDINDSQKYHIDYLPLFYTEDIEKLQVDKPIIKYDFFTLCSYNRERYDQLYELSIRLREFKLKFLIFIPKTTYYKEILKGKKLSNNLLTFIPLNRAEYLRNLSASKAVIDISPSVQSGLPIRIIESLGAGKHIITTNKYVIKEFNDLQLTHVLSADTNFDLILINDFHSNHVLKDYSIANWIRKVFTIN